MSTFLGILIYLWTTLTGLGELPKTPNTTRHGLPLGQPLYFHGVVDPNVCVLIYSDNLEQPD